MNVPGGPLESVIFRFTGTKNAAGDLTQDFAGAISSLRVIVNGETCYDHRAGYSDPDGDTTASQMGYFMNSIGNHLSNMVVASTTAVEAYFRVPLGRQLPAGSEGPQVLNFRWNTGKYAPADISCLCSGLHVAMI
jgi:hypothetical protein